MIQTIQALACFIILPHIRGHQEDDINYAALPLPAQLNCDADAEKRYYQNMHKCSRPTVPCITTNQAQLHIKIRQSTHNKNQPSVKPSQLQLYAYKSRHTISGMYSHNVPLS
jgi:hypothetical protein